MWYNCGANICQCPPGVAVCKVKGQPCNGTQYLPNLCYAESDDGDDWQKPLIGKELAPYGDDWYYVRAGELPRRPPLCRVRSCRRAPLLPLAPSLACARGCARRPGQRVAVRARGRGAVSTR